MHHAPAFVVEVDLHRVAAHVPVQPRAIALVSDGVVESGLGEREIGRRGVPLANGQRAGEDRDEAHGRHEYERPRENR